MKVKALGVATVLLLAACAQHQHAGMCGGSIVKNCNPTVYFDFNSSRLDQTSQEGLDWVGEKLSKRTNSRVVVTGYADKVGEDEANMEISKKRAEAVRDYLIAHQVDPQRITVAYKGNRFATANFDNQYLERKVEITFKKNELNWYDEAYDSMGKKFGYLFE